jgi:hypothetical protein
VGVLPRTRRRSVQRQPEPGKGACGVTRDRLRRPLTEPVCRQVRQLSGSGEGSGTGQGAAASLPEAGREMAARTRASRCHQPGATLRATGMNNFRCSGLERTMRIDEPEVVNCSERGRTPVQESTDQKARAPSR